MTKDQAEQLAREFRVFQHIYSELNEGQQRMMTPGLALISELLDEQQHFGLIRQFPIIKGV